MAEELRVDAEPSEEAGRAGVQALFAKGVDFDAVFATSDLTALGAMRALHEAGRHIPDDVAIVGFDDIAAARLSEPSLTTISQDPRQAGEALVETLVARIEGGEPGSLLLPVKLIVRASS